MRHFERVTAIFCDIYLFFFTLPVFLYNMLLLFISSISILCTSFRIKSSLFFQSLTMPWSFLYIYPPVQIQIFFVNVCLWWQKGLKHPSLYARIKFNTYIIHSGLQHTVEFTHTNKHSFCCDPISINLCIDHLVIKHYSCQNKNEIRKNWCEIHSNISVNMNDLLEHIKYILC